MPGADACMLRLRMAVASCGRGASRTDACRWACAAACSCCWWWLVAGEVWTPWAGETCCSGVRGMLCEWPNCGCGEGWWGSSGTELRWCCACAPGPVAESLSCLNDSAGDGACCGVPPSRRRPLAVRGCPCPYPLALPSSCPEGRRAPFSCEIRG